MNTQFGSRLKEARLQRGLSQKDVADLLEIPERLYRSFEDNKVEIRLYLSVKFCELLNVSFRYIVNETDEFGEYDLNFSYRDMKRHQDWKI